jgi:general secretion pathway protein E
LVRVLCPHCKELYAPNTEQIHELGVSPDDPYKMSDPPGNELYRAGWQKLTPIEPLVPGEFMLYRAVGCDECMGTGYHGRSGVYEMVMITDEVRNNVLRNVDSNTIKQIARNDGMISLRDDGVRKVLMGVTTLEEVLRVTYEDDG